MPRPGRELLTVLLLSAAGLAACAGPAATPPRPPGIVFLTSFSLSGAVVASGSFTDSGSANTSTSCGDYGRHGLLGTYFVPFPPRGQRAAGMPFVYQSLVPAYHGPGDYTDPRSLVEITAGDGTFTGDGARSSLHLTARGDGSGRVSFENFTDVSDPGRVLAGTIDWSCRPAA